MSSALHWIDYLSIAVYLAGTLGLGFWIGRRVHSGRDFFLGGRNLPWWAVGFSLVATDIGGTDLVGVGGAAFRHGLAVANFEWIGCVPAMMLGAFFFIPILWRANVTTIPEFLERRFDVSVRTAVAVCWFVFMACNLGIMLFASAKMAQQLFGWSLPIGIVGAALVVGLYTCSGGLAAVVYTDVLQCVVMIGGCILVLVLGVAHVGGIEALMQQVRELDGAGENRLSLVLPVDTTTPFPWPGILFGLGAILGPAYWNGNQAIVQRSLGARSEHEAAASYVWGSLIKNLIPVLIAVPGLVALVMNPSLPDADASYPWLVNALLPIGLRGVFVAAFVAALMSNVDSYLNSAATILVNDLYKRFLRPTSSERELLNVGRITTLVLMGWAIGFALSLVHMKEGIYALFQTLMAFFQGPAFAVLLLGLVWKRATSLGALLGFLSGVCLGVTLFLLNRPSVCDALGLEPLFRIPQPYLYFSIWAFAATLFVTWAVSVLSRPASAGSASARASVARRVERTASLLLLAAIPVALLLWEPPAGRTALHSIGDVMRAGLLAVPQSAAQALFVLVPAVLLGWVLTFRRSKPMLVRFASLTLLVQISLYLWLGG